MAHKIKDDVVTAIEGFVDDVNKSVPGVHIEMKGTFDRGKNKVVPYNPSTGFGTKLVLSFGDGAAGGAVTNYALNVPRLGDSNSSARSMRLAKDDGEAVTVASSRPQEGKEGVDRDPYGGVLLERAYAMTANSMSFGTLFEDDPTAYLLEGTQEGDKFVQCAEMIAAGGKDKARAVAKGQAVDGLDGVNPIDRMAAWAACDYMGVFQRPDGNRRPAVMAASSVLGLDALKGALAEAGTKALAGDPPALEEILDPSDPAAHQALCGLAVLGYYKTVMNSGEAYAVRRDGSVYAGTADPSPNRKTDPEAVFLRGANARHEMESRTADETGANAGLSGKAPYYCYQKMLGGTGVTREEAAAKKPRVDLHMHYRFYRSAMLGEDPNGPSGAPVAKLTYRGDISSKKADSREIYVDVPGLDPGKMRTLGDELALLEEDKRSGPPFRSRLHGLPAMEGLLESQGREPVLKAAEKLVAADFSTGPDILELELAAFSDDKNAGKRHREGGDPSVTADSMWADYNYAAMRRLGTTRIFQHALDNASGLPDISQGLASFGSLYRTDAAHAGLEAPADAGFLPGRSKGKGRTAASFRNMDYERSAMAALSGWQPGEPWHDALERAGISGMADTYTAALEEFSRCPDALEGSMKINDLMVMVEAYNPQGKADVEGIRDDVAQAYENPGMAAYRPRNAAELKAIRTLAAGWDGVPKVSPAEQDHADGLRKTVDALLERSGDSRAMQFQVEKIFRDESLARDTLYDRRYAELADAFMPPKAPEPAGQSVRHTVLDALMDMKDEVDAREAEKAGQVQGGKDVPV